ncbi:MAG: translocation/assembly module TamB domain-containing protein, partial [Pseudomonadota bacterium]
GSPRMPSGLAFSAVIQELGDYLGSAEGRISAAGRLGLDGDVPWLSLSAGADRLRVDSVEIEGFRIEDLADDSSARTNLVITAVRVSAGEREVRDPRVEVQLGADAQSLDVDIGYEGLRFAAAVEGALDSWSEPTAWVGELEDLEFAFSGHPPVELANPADIRLSQDHVSVERLCLREPGGASLCAAAGWRAGGRTDVSAKLTAMPLTMVNAMVDTGFDFEQRLDGELEWHRTSGAPLSGRAEITASAGQIDSRNRPDVSFLTAEASIGFDIVDGRLLNGSLLLPMPGTGEVSGSFDVLDISNPLDSAIEGRIDANLDDIGLLAALTPLIDDAAGALAAHVDIAGRIGEPALSGEASLSDGRMRYEPLGLELGDIALSGKLNGDRDIDIDGVFTSGAGTGRITSRRREGRGGPIDLKIDGRNLTLINVDDVQAIADLDMGIAYNGGALTIDGSLAVPRALVTPTTLPASRSVESADVVVVNGELPEADAEDDQAALEVFGSLDVELGPNVEVNLGVANATVSGRTLFSWSGPPVPMADGRYDIEGQIQAFGQRLNVTDGRIRFANVSADNPSLRLRAEREIFGNSQVKTAGVLVAGTLNRPTIEAYTVPRTTEERALALLVTGSDFDLEQGVGAVDFGTYIAPRLFVSYGVGIFERDNVISARYDLDGGFGIRATSGQRESGVDIIYRLER